MRIARSSGCRDASRASQSCGCAWWCSAPRRTQLFEADHHRIAEAVQPLHVEHDDLAQVRQPRAHLQRLVELLLVLDEQVDRARVGQQVLDLGGGVGRIDAGAHAARAEHAEVGVEPFAPRVREHRGGLARLEAEPHETEADSRAAVSPSSRQVVPRQMPSSFWRSATLSPRRATAFQKRAGKVSPGMTFMRGSWGHRHVFLRFQRRSPRTPAACMPR